MKLLFRTLLAIVLLDLPCFIIAQTDQIARRVADLNPGSGGSFPTNLTVYGTSVLFSANTLPTGTELWKYDGNAITLAADVNGTSVDTGGGVFAGNSSSPNWLTVFNGALYFTAFEPRHGAELWRYNGNTAVRVTDINADSNDNIKPNPNNSWPSNLISFNNALYFTANNNTARPNYELWKYDGSTTSLVANIHPDIGTNYSSYPTGLTVFNGAFYFMADDGSNGYELWKHDGVKTTMLTNINSGGSSSSSYPNSFTIANNELYFQAFDQTHGYELWKTDGSTASLIEINSGSASSYPQFLTAYNGALYFRATDGLHGYELWKYDGATASLVADINPAGDSYPENLTVFGNALFFSADDGVHGWELWKYDGTNVTMISDLNPGGDSFPVNLTVFNGALYFSATTPETGYELWKSDGQTVTLAADLNPGPGDSYPRYFTPLGTQLVFSATSDGASDWELWTLAPSTQNQPPAVTLTSPVDGAAFLTSDSITVSATASDDGSVNQVEFYVDGNLVGADTTSPYSISTTLTAGSHSLTAKATDNAGSSTTSTAITVTVQEAGNNSPSITLTSPQANKILSAPGTVVLDAAAMDSDGTISRVDFLNGSVALGSSTTTPYELSLTNMPAGVYFFSAVATDDKGARTTSDVIQVSLADMPQIKSITQNGGGYRLEVSGTSGIPHILEASQDLSSWNALATNLPVSGAVTFTDDAVQPERFYRVVVR